MFFRPHGLVKVCSSTCSRTHSCDKLDKKNKKKSKKSKSKHEIDGKGKKKSRPWLIRLCKYFLCR